MDQTELMRSFLRDCHTQQSVDYDSSLNIPLDIRKKYDHRIPHEQMEQLWKNYLRYKFSFLISLDDQKEQAEKLLLSRFSELELFLYGEFVSVWKSEAVLEKHAYYYRVMQIRDEDVHTRWYSMPIDECYIWCQKRNDELKQMDPPQGDHYKILEKIQKDIGDLPFATVEQERALSTASREALHYLTIDINNTYNKLVGINALVDYVDPLGHFLGDAELSRKTAPLGEAAKRNIRDALALTPLIDPFLSDLSIALTQTLYNEGFDEDALLRRFLSEIKLAFHCELCDFLEATQDKSRLLWRAGTVGPEDLSEEYRAFDTDKLRSSIQMHESYGSGIGITGSVLLLKDSLDNIWHHIGSNDVEHDPRQSRQHKSAYEQKMYPGVLKSNGKINNFWILPIFYHTKVGLYGAFRVVNKLTKNGQLQPGGWPYVNRVQLALIALWFSSFLDTILPQLQRKEDFSEAFFWDGQVNKMITKLKLEWINGRVLRGLLRHLKQDINKKEEKHRVGCSILIARTSLHDRPLSMFDNYPLLETLHDEIKSPFDRLDNYHDVVDPQLGAFLFDQHGTFHRVVRLSLAHERDIGYIVTEQIKHTNSDALLLILARDSKTIQIFQNGERIAEIYVSERKSTWCFRYPSFMLEMMRKHAPKAQSEVLEIIQKACLDLSYAGHGALIVVGDTNLENFSLTASRIPLTWRNKKVSEVGKDLFVEFAKLDGAIFVRNDGDIIKVNTIVTSLKDPSVRSFFPERGARHRTGEMISQVESDVLVIIVSENRGISMIAQNKLIMKDT